MKISSIKKIIEYFVNMLKIQKIIFNLKNKIIIKKNNLNKMIPCPILFVISVTVTIKKT